MSREKHNIIIILDSSPSCSDYANFYSSIASQCVKYGDIELYDAPNARLVHYYKSREKAFVKFLTKDDIINNVHKWSMFKNRTIIFFGDFDGFEIAINGTANNKVYYFLTGKKDDFDYEMRNCYGGNSCNTRNLKVYYNITNIKSFMAACKKLK